jgi:hypothetical protein
MSTQHFCDIAAYSHAEVADGVDDVCEKGVNIYYIAIGN